ncbi:MAG TPA: hypothetical protein VKB57_06100 [Acidimicrobiales bacterium]|nr:hypothetical protein [Acidimicrobiales bacterium]
MSPGRPVGAERPAYRAMLTAGDARTCLDHYAALSRDLADRGVRS